MDENSFKTCLDSKKYESKIDKDFQEGNSLGVSGTPTFYIGNDEKGYTQLVGAQPIISFKAVIDEKLK